MHRAAPTLLQQMAKGIWEAAGGGGPPDPAADEAAADLADLYEALNGQPVAELVRRYPDRITGEDLAWFAMTPGEPATAAIYVPTFEVRMEGDELVWGGGERAVRNPAAGARMQILLIEDDAALQRSTTRMIKKIYPDADVLVADNAGAAIGNLETHDVALVISDVDILGPRSGIDVYRWVQDHQPHLLDKYVFFTGNSAADSVHWRVLHKPAGVQELRDAIARPRDGAPQDKVAPLSPQLVAARVLQAMPKIEAVPSGRLPTGMMGTRGRFGPDKVYVSALYRALEHDPQLAGMTLAAFKAYLVAANRDRLISLARADMRGAMDPSEVETSEISDRGATFNFVLDPKAGW